MAGDGHYPNVQIRRPSPMAGRGRSGDTSADARLSVSSAAARTLPGPGPLRGRMPYRRCGRSGLQAAGDLARPVAELRRRPPARHAAARSCAAPSTSASPTSTWPTTTGRRTAARRPTSAGSSREDFRPYRDELVISTKAGYDMWPGPYGELGLPQVPARQPRPEPAAHGPRPRRHLLLAPVRSRHAAARRRSARSTPRCARARRWYAGISSYGPRRTEEALAAAAPTSARRC